MNENLKEIFERNIEISNGMLSVIEFLKDVKKGDIIMIDNSSRDDSFKDATCIGAVAKVCDEPKEIYVQTGFYRYILGDVGIPVKFGYTKSKQFYPESLQFGAISSLGGTAHYNSKMFRGKNEIDAQLKKYNSSFDAFWKSLK